MVPGKLNLLNIVELFAIQICLGGQTGKSNDSVSAIAKIFDERKKFRLALAPEGTRKKVADWKTGFYYIAKKCRWIG